MEFFSVVFQVFGTPATTENEKFKIDRNRAREMNKLGNKALYEIMYLSHNH